MSRRPQWVLLQTVLTLVLLGQRASAQDMTVETRNKVKKAAQAAATPEEEA